MRNLALRNLPPSTTVVSATALLLLIGWFDYLTGPNFSFALFYLPPIALVAWYGGKWLGITAAVEGAVIWFLADYFSRDQFPLALHFWNAFVRLCLFTITSLFVRSLRVQMIGLKTNLNHKTEQLETFHRLLPICSHCQKIRDELGNWHELQKYVQERTDLELSHTLCPDCIDKYHGERMSEAS